MLWWQQPAKSLEENFADGRCNLELLDNQETAVKLRMERTHVCESGLTKASWGLGLLGLRTIGLLHSVDQCSVLLCIFHCYLRCLGDAIKTYHIIKCICWLLVWILTSFVTHCRGLATIAMHCEVQRHVFDFTTWWLHFMGAECRNGCVFRLSHTLYYPRWSKLIQCFICTIVCLVIIAWLWYVETPEFNFFFYFLYDQTEITNEGELLALPKYHVIHDNIWCLSYWLAQACTSETLVLCCERLENSHLHWFLILLSGKAMKRDYTILPCEEEQLVTLGATEIVSHMKDCMLKLVYTAFISGRN